MSIKDTNINIRNSYYKNNRIRTKLLLLIDNEIQSKIKQNNKNLKYKYEDENFFKISFEETFIQNQNNKFDFCSSVILKSKKYDNSGKSFLTTDDSTNKINEKSQEKERDSIHSKTLSKKYNSSNKLLNNVIHFHKKIYSIKNISRQSSTFLILPKQKNGFEYLKNLCNSIKKSKHSKKSAKYIRSNNIKTKLFDLSNDKKINRESNEIKMQKSIKDTNLYSFSLFRKSNKRNILINSKHRISGKSTNSIFITK